MGDRTQAEYTIPKWADDLIGDYIENQLGGHDYRDEGEGYVTFTIHEANYGHYDELEDFLNAMEIPYDHNWGAGAEYEYGSNEVRFDEHGNCFGLEAGPTSGMVDAKELLLILQGEDGAQKATEKLEALIASETSRGPIKEEPLHKERVFICAARNCAENAVYELIKGGVDIHYVDPTTEMNASQIARAEKHDKIAAYIEKTMLKNVIAETAEKTSKTFAKELKTNEGFGL